MLSMGVPPYHRGSAGGGITTRKRWILKTYPQVISGRIILIILGAIIFIGGTFLHLGIEVYDKPDYIYGDDGDGLFNLWVMEHVRTSIINGDWNLADGRIYWPHNEDTYFWSDNLIIPAAGYSLLRLITEDIFTAYRSTAILLSALGYLAFIWLFGILFKFIREEHPGLPGWSQILVILFAYLASFSSSRLVYFVHFQNLSSLWVITLVAGLIAYSRYRKEGYYLISLFSLLILVLSSAYFAITGAIFFLVWLVMEGARSPRDLFRTLRNNLWYELGGAVATVPVVLGYASVKFPGYSLDYIHQMATKPLHLYLPARGLVRILYQFLFHRLPAIHHESPAYLGAGLILGILGLIIWQLPFLLRWLKKALKTPWFWLAIALLLFWKLGAPGWKEINGWAGVGFWTLLLILFLRGAVVRSHNRILAFPLSYLILCLIITYGIAAGPRSHFFEQPINPSIWGICAAILPPLAHMRSIGRLAVIGQGLLFGILLIGLLQALASSRTWLRRSAVTATILIVIFQAADGWRGMAPLHRYDPEMIFPKPDEKEWWSNRKGIVAAFPSRPFQQSTRDMLYYCGFPGIVLLNGYSGHSTPEWDMVMSLGRRWYEPNQEQVNYVEELGVNYLAVRKDRIVRKVVRALRGMDRPILFENDRIIVIGITDVKK